MGRDAEKPPEFFVDRSLRGAEQIERFVRNRHRILRQARKPGPYIYGVYESGLKRLWP